MVKKRKKDNQTVMVWRGSGEIQRKDGTDLGENHKKFRDDSGEVMADG